MKTFSYMLTAVIALASFSSLAATEISRAQAAQHQSIGVVSVSGVWGSPADAVAAMQEKAAAGGASYYRIIDMHSPRQSDNWKVSAEIYK